MTRAARGAGADGEAMKPREAAKLESRRRVLEAARELFTEHGFEGTTMRAVAERAGLATGSVLFHAGSKEALFELVFQDEMESSFARALERAAKVDEPLERLMIAFDSMLVLFDRRRPLARALIASMVMPSAPARSRGFRQRLVPLLEGAPLRDEVTPRQAVKLAFGLHIANVIAMLGEPGLSLARARANLRTALDLLFRGIMRAPRAKR